MKRAKAVTIKKLEKLKSGKVRLVFEPRCIRPLHVSRREASCYSVGEKLIIAGDKICKC